MELELELDLNKKYTYADYLTWFDDKRRELYNGFIKMMTPAPAMRHQAISSELHGTFWHYPFYSNKNEVVDLFYTITECRGWIKSTNIQ